MKCVKCASVNICKNGLISEKQRYKCKNCGYHFTTGRPCKPLYLKRLALELYLSKMNLQMKMKHSKWQINVGVNVIVSFFVTSIRVFAVV